MSLIVSAAYFHLCPTCFSHGSIILANGQSRPEVASYESAIKDFEKCGKEGLISEEESPELKRQIGLATLPCFDEEVELVNSLCAHLMNRVCQQGKNSTVETIDSRVARGVRIPNTEGTA